MSEGKKSRKTAGVKKNSRKEPAQYNHKIQRHERGRQAQGQRTRYKDDRTPFVRTIEPACRIIAVVLSMVLWADVHVLLRGGGYADTTIVPVFGYADSKVESTSMEPAIPARSVIVTKQQPEYQVNDIVLYRSSEEENGLRRVVSVEGGQYRVLGDNETGETPQTVQKDDIWGKVVRHGQWCYGIQRYFRTLHGALTIFLLAIFALLLPDLLMIPRRRRALQEHRAAKAAKESQQSEAQ